MPKQTKITPGLVAEHGLKPEEYELAVKLIGRTLTITELGIFSAMWNEHCSYKSSKKWLKTLPTKNSRVIIGPGENAGVIDIDDGQVAVFKMESHNHPSYIEPYQGAATGVGGILRDVFTMGARPIAALNALRFGAPEHEKTKHLVSGVVAGIGGYGNSFGVPTVGGEVNFHPRYNGNILVNAMAIGIANREEIFTSQAKGIDMPIVYIGAKTGRDGIHGSTMASAEFSDDAEEKRPTVQVGDPFSEKKLLEACLELMKSDAVIAIQDMGAAGLTCSAVEMVAKGNLGIELNLNSVPCREENMTAYEMMLSESQERMLLVLNPEKEEIAQNILAKWQLDFAVIGKTTDDLRFKVWHNSEKVADLPIKELGDQAPEYDRPWVENNSPLFININKIPAPNDLPKVFKTLMASPNLCSRKWVWEQYDHLIQGNTMQKPGGDAAVIRINEKKAIAACVDVTPRYCESNPIVGGKQAVAEVWRNITAVGAQPIAITDNLNFGNPEKPEIMGQLVGCIKGIGEACKALDFPVVSGNVSLYNETNGQAILPTPTIGGVGILKDIKKMATIPFKQENDIILLIGGHGQHMGQTTYLAEIEGREEGSPPPVDLIIEKRNGDFVRELINRELVTASHDVSDGGVGITLAEMAIASGIGFNIDIPDPIHITLFAEDQSRYILTATEEKANNIIAMSSDIEVVKIGHTHSNQIIINNQEIAYINDLSEPYNSWFDKFMS